MTTKAQLKDVQSLILGQPCVGELPDDPLFRRLVNAVKAMRRPESVGPADLAVLVRQFLIREQDPNVSLGLEVPDTNGWPDATQWGISGCSCVPYKRGASWVTAKAWAPTWVDATGLEKIAAAFREEPRRPRQSVPADPVVSDLVPIYGGNYASNGQQEAVRSVFIAPPGTTILACLPTGGGKTLVFQVVALRGVRDNKLVIVVVPTVALARAQEFRFRDLLRESGHETQASKPLAYHSGLTVDDRAALMEGLRDGSVPIVFTSPEAALGVLRRPLLAAAREGRIALFAIDEAHMVSQWGDSFRPLFQLLVGLRDELMCEASNAGHERFPTLLLTATLTEEGYVTLKQAFERESGFQVVAEPRLREEPAIIVAQAPDEETRRQRILDAIPYLPRPLILYTTERADATDWNQLLLVRGYRRVRVVKGGDMATKKGEKVLEEWKNRSVDIIVATSAFGLGVDQGDVRAIVHACLPESLDRFYQEVGRSGRDGSASVALLVPAPEDRPVAESLASNPSISVDRGLERWLSMLRSRQDESAPNGKIIVPLDALPSRIPYSSELNVAWNQRTLVLMARAGLIRFGCVPPLKIEELEEESPEEFDERCKQALEADALKAAVEIEDEGHARLATWNSRVEPVRKWLREQDLQTIALLDALLSGSSSPADLFRTVYTVDAAGICPPRLGYEPGVVTLKDVRSFLSASLRALFESSAVNGRLFVHYDAPAESLARLRWKTDVAQRTLERLAHAGVLEFSLPDDFVDRTSVWKTLANRSPARFVCKVDDGGTVETRKRPRLTVLGASQTVDDVRAALEVERDYHILLFPSGAPDPFNPLRRLKDTVTSMSIGALAGRLTQ